MISVIIPFFNSENYLNKCLNSVKRQSYSDFEVILIDDGSTDNSKQICEEYNKTDNRFKYFYCNHSGVSSSRNKGLIEAKGEYIYFLDSDDELESDALSVLLKELVVNNTDLVVCGYNRIEHSKRITVTPQKAIYDISGSFGLVVNSLCKKDSLNQLWNKLFKKEKISFLFDESLKSREDLKFVLQYIKNINVVTFSDCLVYNYYVREDSISRAPEKYSNRLDSLLESISVYSQTKKERDGVDSFLKDFFIKKAMKEIAYIFEVNALNDKTLQIDDMIRNIELQKLLVNKPKELSFINLESSEETKRKILQRTRLKRLLKRLFRF